MSNKKVGRRAIMITIGEETKNLAEWAEIAGISRQAMSARYKKGVRGVDLIQPASPSPEGTGRDYSFMVGEQYGMLKVLSVEKYHAMATCDCGTTKRFSVYNILRGTSRSCGCQWGRKKKE